VSKDMVFVGSFDKNLYCLSAKNGKEIWRFATGEEIFNISPFPVHNGIIYCASMDSYLYAIDIKNGKEVWRFKTGKYGNSSSPTLYNNLLFHPSRDGFLYALTLDGKVLWRFEYGKIIGPVIAANKRLYVGGEDYFIYCLSLDGKPIWRFRAGYYVFWLSEVWENKLYAGSWDCHLYAIDVTSGKELWRFATSTLQPSYLPPAYEAWETEIKTEGGEDYEESKEDKYARSLAMQEFGEYKAKSEYAMKSEYTSKSEYK